MNVHPALAGRRIGDIVIRLVTAAGLTVDAVIHLQLASNYQAAAPGGIGQGNLFRIEAALAVLAALWVLIRGSRAAYGAALLVAASALGAVLLYRYQHVPAFGPIPAMYEPVWFFKKTVTAIAEAAAVVTALVGMVSGARMGTQIRRQVRGASRSSLVSDQSSARRRSWSPVRAPSHRMRD